MAIVNKRPCFPTTMQTPQPDATVFFTDRHSSLVFTCGWRDLRTFGRLASCLSLCSTLSSTLKVPCTRTVALPLLVLRSRNLSEEMTMRAVPCPPGKTDFTWVVAVGTSAKARRCWRIITGDGQLFTYRYIYLHLFILYLTALPTLQHPLEAVVRMRRALEGSRVLGYGDG